MASYFKMKILNPGSGGMLRILGSLHKYVRNFDERVVFGGDQLTEERAAVVQRLRQNGATLQGRLSGLLPTAHSWNAKMI